MTQRFRPLAHWLDGQPPPVFNGATWGMPWPRGAAREKTLFALRDPSGQSMPVQSWPVAYWPDGSLKWTAHAVPADAPLSDGSLEVVPHHSPAAPPRILQLDETAAAIEIDTGVMRCRVPREGAQVIATIRRGDREWLRDGRLVLLRQDRVDPEDAACVRQETFESAIERVTIEQRGPIRAVIKVEGRHADPAGRRWLPFTLRLYFYAGAESLRVMHTIVFDGDEWSDFIRGVGMRFSIPLRDPLHDRHVRFAGENEGVFAEAVRGGGSFESPTGPLAAHRLCGASKTRQSSGRARLEGTRRGRWRLFG